MQIEKALRLSLPYINAHQGKLFVIFINGESISSRCLKQHIDDITLLNSLGVRIVVVFGARPQIDQNCLEKQLKSRFFQGNRLTDAATMTCVKSAVGDIRFHLESLFAQGLPYTSGFGFHSHCISANFVIAQPIGVLKGVDHGYTGKIRQIETQTIKNQLAENNIVLLSPLGLSLTGELFNCKAEDIAVEVASNLEADKLIIFSDLKAHDSLDREMRLNQINHYLLEKMEDEFSTHLKLAKKAIKKVKRIHIIEREKDGALLGELFTRDGSGVMVSGGLYDEMRDATDTDVAGILNIIRPLEDQEILVKRSEEQLELDIQHYKVIERDGLITACIALFPFAKENMAEIACLAVHADYQNRGYGDRLLKEMEKKARKQGITCVFVLTTQTSQWFIERGYQRTTESVLPGSKKLQLNQQRNAKVLLKNLDSH